MNSELKNTYTTVIKPPSGGQFIDFTELKAYRDLFYFLVWRDIKVLYAQTILGFSWAILNPFMQIVIFSIIFGKVAKIDTDGIPYVLFSTVAVIPWTYMSQALGKSSNSLVADQALLGKVYFPRLIIPTIPILAKLVDFAISCILLVAVLVYYQVAPTWNLIFLPFFILLMISVPFGLGLWMSALAIRYRDVKFALPFFISMLIYSAPIVYSASNIPEQYRLIYSLNPIVGVIEGFRACFLGSPIPWDFIIPGAVTSVILVLGGIFYFKKMEHVFVDVI